MRRWLWRHFDGLMWRAWGRGYIRCRYCFTMERDEWASMCDCWLAERRMPNNPHLK